MNTGSAARTYEGTVYSNSGNRALIDLVPESAHRILDIGCGAGDNARLLTEAGHEVWGVTASAREAHLASRFCRGVSVCDIEQEIPSDLPARFDLLLCSHVLEHLRNPAETLRVLADHLVDGGFVAIAVPNMAHWRIRARILRGDWSREDHGAFDRTHLHFWSYLTIGDVVASGPFKITLHTGDYALPQWPLRRLWPRAASYVDRHLGPKVPNLAAGQTLLLARKLSANSSKLQADDLGSELS